MTAPWLVSQVGVPVPGRRRLPRPLGRTGGQMAAVGLAGAALILLIAHTALVGLRQVDHAYAAVGQIATAQRAFQHADMLHDALRADVALALAQMPGTQGPDTHTGVAIDAPGFRADLRAAAAVRLPGRLSVSLQALRPEQEQFADDAERIVAQAQVDGQAEMLAARAQWPAFKALFNELADAQAAVVAQLSEQSGQKEQLADSGQRTARTRLAAAAAAALVGFLGIALLLGRQGRRLAELAARERGVAETLQHSLLPDRLPDLPGVALAARYVPCGTGVEVGGDWYDVLPLPGGEVGLVMGDVAGHDLGAAAVMGQLRNALRAYASEGLPPGAVLERLNQMCHQQRTGVMSTCLYAVLDPVARVLTVANAGHYPPLLVLPDGGTRFLERPGCPPIGAVRESAYPETTYELEPGASVVLYTDGLVERRTRPVDEGLELLAREAASLPAGLEAACDHLLEVLLADGAPEDDVALLVVAPAMLLGPHLDLVMPAEPDRLVDLRRALGRWLDEAGADEDERYEVLVACSEAATNAVEHAYGPGAASYQVVGDWDPETGEISLLVRDWGRWRSPRGQDRGRGLGLMTALMDDVTVDRGGPTAGGTSVLMRRRLAACTHPAGSEVSTGERVSA